MVGVTNSFSHAPLAKVSFHSFSAAQKNADAVNQIARVRSVQDFVAVQSDLARDNLEKVIETNKRIAETSLRIAEEAGRVIQAQAQANRRRAA